MSDQLTLSAQAKKNVETWLLGPYDETTKAHIRKLSTQDPKALEDAFYRNLDFGTGGLRGIMGVGTNRVNAYTLSMITQGICDYLHQLFPQKDKKIVLAYDTRRDSYEFALQCAKVFAANKIQVHLYKQIRPLPLLSFSCLHLQCDLAVMITASHNPAEYNGYKVFWSNGAQVLPPHDENILKATQAICSIQQVQFSTLEDPLIQWVGEEIDLAYEKAIEKQQLYPQMDTAKKDTLRLLYSPLHGTGHTIIPKLLKSRGFNNVSLVQKQSQPDPQFSTVEAPNPEEDQALKMGIKQMLIEKADLFIATDPDADRLACVVYHDNKGVKLDGNETAIIMTHHLLETLSQQNRLPQNPAIVKTIVTSPLINKICGHYKVMCPDVLTGFKYIGQLMTQWQQEASHNFLLGAEESYGYLIGSHTKDKDAVVCAAFLAELALVKKLAGQTLIDYLQEIYQIHGFAHNELFNLKLKSGQQGLAQKDKLMAQLREPSHLFLDDQAIIAKKDYQYSTAINLVDNKNTPLTLPKSNVIVWELANGLNITVRPSGTEPKVKFYFSFIHEMRHSYTEEKEKAKKTIEKYYTALKNELQIT